MYDNFVYVYKCVYVYVCMHACIFMDVFICKCMYGWEKNSLIYLKTIQIHYLDYYKITLLIFYMLNVFKKKSKIYFGIHLHIKIVIK